MNTVHVVPLHDVIEHLVPGGLDDQDQHPKPWLSIEEDDDPRGTRPGRLQRAGRGIIGDLVIGKVADFGAEHTVMAKSDSLDWIAQLGLLHGALQVVDNDPPISAD